MCASGLWASERPASAQSCTLSIDNLSFGQVQTSNGLAIDLNTTLRATCTINSLLSLGPVYICPYIGDGGGGSINPDRTMANGANKLRFQLYSVAGATVWGSPGWNGTTAPRLSVPTLNVLGLNLLGGSGSWTIYGRILANQQSAQPGFYQSVIDGIHLNFRVGTSLAACSSTYGSLASPQPAFTVSATVMPSCTIATTSVAFPNTGLLDANVDAQGSVRVTCSNGAAWTAAFEVPSGETAAARRMYKGTTDSVTYSLYKNNDPAQVLGMASGQTISGTGNGGTQTTTVYGRVPPQSTPPAGTYTDTVVVTLTY